MKPFLVPAGVLIYVAIVITVAMQLKAPVIHTRTVQTIAIDLDDEYERGLQNGN